MVTKRHELAATHNEYLIQKLNQIQLKKQLKQDWANLQEQFRLISTQYQMQEDLVKISEERYRTSLPTATTGTTFQQNVIDFQNEWIRSQLLLNSIRAEYMINQLQALTFHGHKHIFKVINRLQQ